LYRPGCKLVSSATYWSENCNKQEQCKNATIALAGEKSGKMQECNQKPWGKNPWTKTH
jgi:hypothetical protein